MRDARWWSGGTRAKNPEIPAASELTATDRSGLTSVSAYVCPSRRAPGAEAPDSGANAHAEAAGSSAMPGPQTDYAVSVMGNPTAAQLAANPHLHGWWWSIDTDQPYSSHHRGAFRSALLTANSDATHAWIDRFTSVCNGWRVRDTFSRWSDGTSNQIIFGEKHIPASLVGQCRTEQSITNGDCSYMSSEQLGAAVISRQFSMGSIDNAPDGTGYVLGGPWGNYQYPLQKGNEKGGADIAGQGSIYHHGFGSAHPSVCNFLLGDGSVQSFSVTTPVNPILISWGLVNSGRAVAIP